MTEATVIVTGADGGMGSALVDRLLSMTNWDILAIDRNQIEERNRLSTLTVNLLDSNIEELVNDSINHLPSVIGLVNLAAISKGDELIEMDDESWTHSMKLNVTTPMLLARTIIPKMMENRGGSIVNVGSPVGFIGARKPSYSASKAALHGLTMSIARQYGKFGIRCNTLLPGATITKMTSDWSQEKQDAIAKNSFRKQLTTPDEIASVIHFLLSNESSCITGSIIDATAGQMLGAH